VQIQKVRLGYKPRLDGIRAIAVLLVIASHCFTWAGGAGAIGVGTFVVLSGFLITAVLDEEIAATGILNLRNFYMRRVLRLYPALVAVVGIYLLGLAVGLWPTAIWKGLRAALMALTYTTDIFTVVGKGRWIQLELLLTWTLAVEEQFYLVWPVVYRWLTHRFPSVRAQISVLATLIVLAAATRALVSTQAAVTLSPIAWTDALLIGCSAGILFRNGWIRPRRLRAHELLLLGLPAAWLFHFGSSNWMAETVGLTVFDVTVVVWLFHAIADIDRVDFLGAKPLVHLGRISYGLYIWHSLILAALLRWWDAGTIVLFVAELLVTLLVAELSYRFLELPFLRLKTKYRS
jgi:peptidoglycan/LPS O-acetylase OafA/YrhL